MVRNLAITFALAALSSRWSARAAQTPGTFDDGGNTLVSAMMMFLGNEQNVYILDKTEGNQAQVNGHAAWGAVWDIASRTAQAMDVRSNTFCASGMHLPNGSFATFGGNGAVGPGGTLGDQLYTPSNTFTAEFDTVYDDWDGTKAIRILNPCNGSSAATDASCQWYDDATVLSMQRQRWYSTAEALGDGSIALIGGFANGGYVNRVFPNVDPAEGGAAELTTEFFPSRGPPQNMAFMNLTSGLNAYAHAFLMPSGKMLVQANFSTILWDPDTNEETPLPDMPGQVVRVYPASGGAAMLPLTPANDYTPTVLFCGGSDMPSDAYGNYSWPFINTWEFPASADCQRITPEPTDGSAVDYVQDDDMPEGRTMGQLILLPTGQAMVFNGGLNGTAGYSNMTLQTLSWSDMPFGLSLASGPVGRPALYDPSKVAGQRWSTDGFDTSPIPRLYHSSALLLPDASVLIAGSNPNLDVNLSTTFPTTYKAEVFYPPYFSASVRPAPTGMPSTISYGGDWFNLTVPASSYGGSSDDAAASTTVVLLRPGWTTHGMNMGQRLLQLNNTYTVNDNGDITLHVSQAPPNANLLTPGPALMFVNVNGVPSNGTMIIVGNGQVGTQPTADAAILPDSVLSASASGSANMNTSSSGSGGSGSSPGSGNGHHSGSVPIHVPALLSVLAVLLAGITGTLVL